MTASDLSVPRRRLLQAAALLAFTTARGAHSQPDKAAFPRRPVRIVVGYPAGQTVSGKIKVLAVSSKARYRALPNVPRVAEQGVPDFEVASWSALMAPAGTPPAVVEKINADMITASRTEAAITAVRAGGSETGDLSTVQCRDFLRRETAMWAEAAKRAEVTPE